MGGPDRQRRSGGPRGRRAGCAARRGALAAVGAARPPLGHRRHPRDDGARSRAGSRGARPRGAPRRGASDRPGSRCGERRPRRPRSHDDPARERRHHHRAGHHGGRSDARGPRVPVPDRGRPRSWRRGGRRPGHRRVHPPRRRAPPAARQLVRAAVPRHPRPALGRPGDGRAPPTRGEGGGRRDEEPERRDDGGHPAARDPDHCRPAPRRRSARRAVRRRPGGLGELRVRAGHGELVGRETGPGAGAVAAARRQRVRSSRR